MREKIKISRSNPFAGSLVKETHLHLAPRSQTKHTQAHFVDGYANALASVDGPGEAVAHTPGFIDASVMALVATIFIFVLRLVNCKQRIRQEGSVALLSFTASNRSTIQMLREKCDEFLSQPDGVSDEISRKLVNELKGYLLDLDPIELGSYFTALQNDHASPEDLKAIIQSLLRRVADLEADVKMLLSNQRKGEALYLAAEVISMFETFCYLKKEDPNHFTVQHVDDIQDPKDLYKVFNGAIDELRLRRNAAAHPSLNAEDYTWDDVIESIKWLPGLDTFKLQISSVLMEIRAKTRLPKPFAYYTDMWKRSQELKRNKTGGQTNT